MVIMKDTVKMAPGTATVPITSNLSFTRVKVALYMKLHEPLARTHLLAHSCLM